MSGTKTTRPKKNSMSKESVQYAPHEEIATALRALDIRLNTAIEIFEENHAGAINDRFRGLYISSSDARGSLHSGNIEFNPDTNKEINSEPLWVPSKGTLAERFVLLFGLDQFELDVLLMAFAPEFDLRYERVYAYLQDDVTRKRPTIDLILSLLSTGAAERLAHRSKFASDSPLLSNHIVDLISDPNQVHPPLLAQYVKPDEQIVRFILSDYGLDSRLTGCCRVAQPQSVAPIFTPTLKTKNDVQRVLSESKGQGSCFWLHGPQGVGKGQAAQEIANELGSALLILDAGRVELLDLERILQLSFREAWFRSAVLYVEHAECWLHEPKSVVSLASILKERKCMAIIGSTESLPVDMLGVARPIKFTIPETSQRIYCWQAELSDSKVKLRKNTVTMLASRFKLTSEQISSAVADALLRAGSKPEAEDFLAAARAQSRHSLTSVADKIVPHATWDDIVLPNDAVAQLRELCNRVDQKDRVFNEWGLGNNLTRGRGTAVLFSGGSGTGKTMAAEVVANALGLELYRINLARVVSKYIGETEKNLERVFAAAENANAILFFDEAEALFGKRSEVKDAHDRYANIEIAYLLQKMEDHDGVTILTTNMADSLDEAMTRRLAFHIYFPFPDESARLNLWEQAWSDLTPLGKQVDRNILAKELKFSGGAIHNVALGAAFLAAGNGNIVESNHILQSVRRERQKYGYAEEGLWE